jgi:hypothetical protein
MIWTLNELPQRLKYDFYSLNRPSADEANGPFYRLRKLAQHERYPTDREMGKSHVAPLNIYIPSFRETS